MYRPVAPHVDLPAMEHEVLQFWRDDDIFARSLEQRKDGQLWVFYEGPPTANGRPGTHHIEARVFKDVFPRYRTMKGFNVPRKAGWDCHGLPVEIAVERELGFSGKGDIESFGVAKFNELCRASVLRHVAEFENMTERMGYWVDTSEAYWTMDGDYIDSLWWALQRIHERGLLVQDHRVSPYCPRCGTGLSDHELAQGYETVVDPSVYVRLPIVAGPFSELGAALLIWTTTPWTLVANTAVAVNPDVEYVLIRTDEGELLVLAEPLVDAVLGQTTERIQSLSGRELVGAAYRPPFELVSIRDATSPKTDGSSSSVHSVVPGDYVTVTEGTGLVHLAPAFGPEDLALGRRFNLPVVNPVGADGHFRADIDLVGGAFFKKADELLVTDLAQRGLLFRHQPYEHSYPHCWRCHTPLMYYAQPSWYIKTTAIKDQLTAENEQTNWFPPTIKHGRFGDWLANNVDWALSRNRYWGTPLPIWRCASKHVTVVGSRAELAMLSRTDVADMDPHRPFVDEVQFACPECEAPSTRVPEVVDVWFDSGCMPFAQWGYPHQGQDQFAKQYPADYICEAIDQTRGWFYTLMTVGTLVFDRSSYQNVLCLGHLLDKDGRKMSKHLGNALEPFGLMDRHGADAVRWFMLAAGSPWGSRRVSHESIADVVRRVLLTYWSTVSFQVLYARAAGWSPDVDTALPVAERSVLDQWLCSQTHQLVRDVEQALERFDTQQAGQSIAAFVDELSNWYVRRSRRRFWEGDRSALTTLHETLETLTLVMAPMTPFITEQVWQDVVRPTSSTRATSVHLADWPLVDDAQVQPHLAFQMAQLRRLVELGRAARAQSGIKTRQPLSRALVAAPGWEGVAPELRDHLAAELNVQAIDLLSREGDLVQVSAKANFRTLGRRFGNRTPAIAAAVAASDAARLSDELGATGEAHLVLMGDDIRLDAEDVIFTETPQEGWAVQHEGGESIALDLTITSQLRGLGLARDVVRLIQEARKEQGFDVSDRIHLWWEAEAETADFVATHGSYIAREVLASTTTRGFELAPTDAPRRTASEPQFTFSIARIEPD